VIRVDNSTGIVDVVPVYMGHVPMDEAVTRYFLTHYILVCERFNLVTAESDYEECGAFPYRATPIKRGTRCGIRTIQGHRSMCTNDGSSVRVEVESVSFFKRANGVEDLAQVRYLKAEHPGGGAAEHVTHWIATVQYAYSAPSKDPKNTPLEPAWFQDRRAGSEPEVLTTPLATSDAALAGSLRWSCAPRELSRRALLYLPRRPSRCSAPARRSPRQSLYAAGPPIAGFAQRSMTATRCTAIITAMWANEIDRQFDGRSIFRNSTDIERSIAGHLVAVIDRCANPAIGGPAQRDCLGERRAGAEQREGRRGRYKSAAPREFTRSAAHRSDPANAASEVARGVVSTSGSDPSSTILKPSGFQRRVFGSFEGAE